MLKDRSWHEEAACNGHPDPDLWHYKGSYIKDEQLLSAYRCAEAISICNTCPVKAQCLEQGMEDENLENSAGQGSIWGGLLTSERVMLMGGTHTTRKVRVENRIRRETRALTDRIPQ